LRVLRGALSIERPRLITTGRWDGLELPAAARFSGVRRHVPLETVDEASAAAAEADGLVALGGGSAIDTAKAVSAATGLPVISIPTTYSGAEWTGGFGVRDEERGVKLGGGGARVEGIVYDPDKVWDGRFELASDRYNKLPGTGPFRGYNWLKKTPTDSAAAATALATGIKTYNTAINVAKLPDPSNPPPKGPSGTAQAG